jgi:hypothetical protein
MSGRYKAAIAKFFASRGDSTVFYETRFRTQHTHVQAIGMPADVASQVYDAFVVEGARAGIQFVERKGKVRGFGNAVRFWWDSRLLPSVRKKTL